MWLIRRKQPALLQKVLGTNDTGYIIDVSRFHAAVQCSLDDYVRRIVEPARSTLRSNLWRKMDQICRVRTALGAMYEIEAGDA